MKINKKYFTIILIIVLCILLGIVSYIIRLKNIRMDYEYFSDLYDDSQNNYIQNGNFNGGKNITNSVTNGNVNIVIMRNNPGSTSYVLEMTRQKNTKTSLEIDIKNIKASKTYKLCFWYSVKNSKGIFDPVKDIKFIISTTTHNHKYLLAKKGDKSESDFASYGNRDWKKIALYVTTPDDMNTEKDLKIIFNNSNNLVAEKINFTSISLISILPDASNFTVTNELKLLVLPVGYRAGLKSWKDSSNNGNDLIFKTMPTANVNAGNSLITSKNKISSTSMASDIFGTVCDKFTIFFYFTTDNISSNNYDTNILTIPGNQNTALQIIMNITKGTIKCILNDNDTKSTNNIIELEKSFVFNKSLLSFEYDKSKTSFTIKSDGVEVGHSTNVGILYPSSNNPIVINNNLEWNVNLYGFGVYNRLLTEKEYNEINLYFVNNSNNKSKYQQNTLSYSTDVNTIPQTTADQTDQQISDNTYDNTTDNYNSYEVEDEYSTQPANLYKNCLVDCDNLCKQFKNDKHKYKKCRSKWCKQLESCDNYCITSNNNTSMICNDIDSSCPVVYLKDGQYYIYIPENSTLANQYGYSGERNYGSTRDKARQIYERNFPGCELPDILKYEGGEHPMSNCPFKMHQGDNPCQSTECAGIDWSAPVEQQNTCKSCKTVISNYCNRYKDIDESCICWSDEYKDLGECKAFRSYYEDPNDYNCSIDNFNIDQHPDYNLYIRKDKIPCWSCDLTGKNTKYDNTGNRHNR